MWLDLHFEQAAPVTTKSPPAGHEPVSIETRLQSPTLGSGSDNFRTDIQGLRAFAVLAVLAYHLNTGWLPGGFAGVDVFFVISGFLITLHLVAEVQRSGTLSVARFWGRRILRLIPAATVVLLATAGVVILATPRVGWGRFGIDFAAAASYCLNWVLAERSVNYLAEDAIASPVEHYWSLGVEEQFYLLWPVFITGLALLAQRRRLRVRPMLLACIAGLAALSFGYATLRVSVGDPSAYFVTTSRLWELAVGAVAALVVHRVRAAFSVAVRGVAITLGFALMMVSVVFLDGTGWPSWRAMVPTAGTALVLLGGGRARPRGMERLLGSRPLVWVGGISYAVYLWHWPLISLAHRHWLNFSALGTICLAAASIALAWLTQRLVEDPIRFAPWLRVQAWRPFALGAVCLGVSLIVSVALIAVAPAPTLTAPPGAHPAGAQVLPARIDLVQHPAWSDGVNWALPAAADAVADVPRAYTEGCQQSLYDVAPLSCTYGDTSSTRIVALVGDSKALQWLPALDRLAGERGVKIVTYVKSGCPLADVRVLRSDGQPYPSCRAWYGNVMTELDRMRPTLVVTSQARRDGMVQNGEAPTSEAMTAGLERTWGVLAADGIVVSVFADTPQPYGNIAECVAEFGDHLGRCEYARAPAVANSAQPSQFMAVRLSGGSMIDASGTIRGGTNRSLFLFDLTDSVCPDIRSCPPIIGNVLIYRSGSHLTKTYAISTANRVETLLHTAKLI